MIQYVTLFLLFTQGMFGCTKNSTTFVSAQKTSVGKTMNSSADHEKLINDTEIKPDSYPVADASSGNLALYKPNAPQEDLVSIAAGLEAFTLDLYHQLRSGSGNLFLSPYSISTAIAMAYAGARNQTAKEMASVFRFSLPNDRLHAGYASLGAGLSSSKQLSLYGANALWVCQGCTVKKTYIQLAQLNYRAMVQELNFNDEASSRRRINRWVEKQTRQKIKDLISKGVLDPFTKLVLTNAVYFKGSWASRFDEKNTSALPFHLLDAGFVRVPMMQQTTQCNYAEHADIQVLELPYRGGSVSMIILLPKENNGLPKLEQKLSPHFLDKAISKLKQQKVEVFLPKFRLEGSYSLVRMLVALGMQAAFDKNRADFTGIQAGKGTLHISDVLHKSFIEVNEEGSEAAAATAVVLTFSASAVQNKVFRADHPFIFMIRHNPTGAMLFLGRLFDPSD